MTDPIFGPVNAFHSGSPGFASGIRRHSCRHFKMSFVLFTAIVISTGGHWICGSYIQLLAFIIRGY